MPVNELEVAQLYRRCDASDLPFETTADLEPLMEVLGQPRAVEAVKFGMDIGGDGYNIFAIGPPGTGKRSMIEQYLNQRAPKEAAPPDWCYVNNFDDPQKPRAIQLPSGRGPGLHEDMEQFTEDVRRVIPAAFESDEYRQRREALEQETFSEQQEQLERVHQKAEQEGLKVVWTPTGIVFAPVVDGKPMEPEQVDELPEDVRNRLQEKAEELQQEILEIMQQAPRAQRAGRKKLKELNRNVAREAFEPLLGELRDKYRDMPQIVQFLDAVKGDLMEKAETLIRAHSGGGGGEQQALSDGMLVTQQQVMESAVLRGYRVNVLVTNNPEGGAPVVYEENPTYHNLIGRIEHTAQMGTLMTDFSLLRAGSVLRANGGYLVIDIHKILTVPFAWDALKRALQTRNVRLESPGQSLGLISTVSLEPQPVPLKVKVVLLGTRLLYYLLREYDPEFGDLVKVPADFASDMDRNDQDISYARLLATIAKRDDLRPFDKNAVARVIEHSSRIAGDAQKVSIHMREVVDLLKEADHWSRQNGHDVVRVDDVQRAIETQIYRAGRMQEQLREMTARNIMLVDVEGEKVGQVNGIAVFPFGDLLYGHPSRITARTRMGDGHVVDIEREVELGGPLHTKGILILQGYIAERYAQEQPLSLSASLVFEQSYGPIGGDSASSAELYALLSSIAQVPIQQRFAVTGSVNQHGQVQAIGAVNEKIEGFYGVCKAKGLTGEQGVLIPASNVQHLMLNQEVVDAVTNGKFHIYAVQTIDQGLELLTGIPAGEPDKEGNYPEDSLNGRIVARLRELAETRKEFGASLGKEAVSNHEVPEEPGEEIPKKTWPSRNR